MSILVAVCHPPRGRGSGSAAGIIGPRLRQDKAAGLDAGPPSPAPLAAVAVQTPALADLPALTGLQAATRPTGSCLAFWLVWFRPRFTGPGMIYIKPYINWLSYYAVLITVWL